MKKDFEDKKNSKFGSAGKDDKNEKDTRFNKSRGVRGRAQKRSGAKGGSNRSTNDTSSKGNERSSTRRITSGSFSDDANWFTCANPEIAGAAANISYYNPSGLLYQYNDPNPDDTITQRSVPGVGVIYWEPSVGYSDGQNSAINVSARNIYSFVRHDNSGSANYFSTDQMLYIIAMDGIYSWIQTLRRVYGICKLYSTQNRYVGKALVEALGFNYDDIIQNIEDFRAYINIIAVKAGSMCIPETQPFIKRHLLMNEAIYFDTPTDKSQFYAYVQAAYPKFSLDKNNSYKGQITWEFIPAMDAVVNCNSSFVANTSALFSWSQDVADDLGYYSIKEFTNKLLDPVLNSEDFAIMSGDILKAYGAEGVIKLDALANDYLTPIAYEPAILDQINNTTFLGTYTVSDAISQVVPDPVNDPKNSYLTFKPTFHYYTRSIPTENFLTPIAHNWTINFDHSDITSDETMCATRLTNVLTEDGFTTERARGYSYTTAKGTSLTIGSEFAVCMCIFYYGRNPDNHNVELVKSDWIYTSNPVLLQSSVYAEEDPDDAANIIANINALTVSRLALLDKFDRHPRVVVPFQYEYTDPEDAEADPVLSDPNWLDVHGDLNYFTFITPEKLQMFSSCALVSEFDVTQYGRSGI